MWAKCQASNAFFSRRKPLGFWMLALPCPFVCSLIPTDHARKIFGLARKSAWKNFGLAQKRARKILGFAPEMAPGIFWPPRKYLGIFLGTFWAKPGIFLGPCRAEPGKLPGKFWPSLKNRPEKLGVCSENGAQNFYPSSKIAGNFPWDLPLEARYLFKGYAL